MLVWEGLRRSQSTRMTFFPFCAKEMARFAATVDLPSPGMELVTMSTFFPSS